MKNRRAAFVLSFAGLAIVACQVVAGIEPVEKRDPSAAQEGGSSGGEGGSSGSSDPCGHVQPPELPEKDDAPEDEEPPFFLALRTIKLIPEPTDVYQGYDLDNVCPCDRRKGTAFEGASSCKGVTADDCDRDGGIDNSAVGLFQTFAPTGFSPDKAANQGIVDGRRGLLIRVAKYNGKANDRDVIVGAMISHGILDGRGCETTVNPSLDRAPPGWCGGDLWTYPQAFVKPGVTEPISSGSGWVKDGELVYKSQSSVRMFLAGAVISFNLPITAGRLSKVEGRWHFEGMLTGRIPVSDLLRAVGSVETDNQKLCQTAYFSLGVKPELCKRADIMETDRFDNEDPPQGCNAVSASVLFTADEAAVGGERTERDEDTGCEGVDQTLFQCN